jgi:hypothetical protein
MSSMSLEVSILTLTSKHSPQHPVHSYKTTGKVITFHTVLQSCVSRQQTDAKPHRARGQGLANTRVT